MGAIIVIIKKELTYSTFQPSEMSYHVLKGENNKKKGKQTTKIINLTVYINILFFKTKIRIFFCLVNWERSRITFFFHFSFIFDRVNNRYSTIMLIIIPFG